MVLNFAYDVFLCVVAALGRGPFSFRTSSFVVITAIRLRRTPCPRSGSKAFVPVRYPYGFGSPAAILVSCSRSLHTLTQASSAWVQVPPVLRAQDQNQALAQFQVQAQALAQAQSALAQAQTQALAQAWAQAQSQALALAQMQALTPAAVALSLVSFP